MPGKADRVLSPFGEAAVALDEELQRFRALTEAARRPPLDGRRNLERAARAAREAFESRAALAERMRALVETLNAARVENDLCSEALDRRQEEIAERAARMDAILGRFSALGTAAAELSGAARSAGERAQSTPTGTTALDELERIETRLGEVADEARSVSREAFDSGLPELGADIESLRQQLLGARNRAALARRKIAEAGPDEPGRN